MNISNRVFFSCLFCLAEISLLLVFRVPHAIAAQGTHVSGEIGNGTAWTASGSPYVLDADVRVSGGALEAEEGTRVTGPGHLIISGGSLRMTGVRLDGGATITGFDADLSLSSTTIFAGDGDAVHLEGGHLDARHLRLERNSGAGLFVSDSVRGSGTADIYDSVLKENGQAVVNKTQLPVEAQNDWWGQSSGPKFSGHNGVTGKVAYSPWLAEEPDRACCSSVLFIPGIEGTRLYSGSERVWEPLGNGDVRKLYLDGTGASIGRITPGEVIGKAYGLSDVYSKFLSFLDSLVAGGSIAEARSFGYDWRKQPDSVAGQDLENVIEQMAAGSRTGKVIIVAHSNGGLVAKALMKRLAEEGKVDLVDKLISVAVPYAGTPESILALLHGDRQEILGGLIMSADTAKGLAQNMPSAYTLLPSAAFPSSTPLISGLANAKDHAGLVDFLKGKANDLLMAAADAFHLAVDPFMWPRELVHVAVAGWNVLTAEGVHYSQYLDCRLWLLRRICKVAEAHTADMTQAGDGTVLFTSAAYNAGQLASLDLGTVSHEEGTDIAHANILESQTAQTVIRHIVLDNPLGTLSADGFLLSGEPADEKSYIRFSVEGPADLKVLGSDRQPAGITRRFHDGDATSTSVYVPATAGAHYSVAITGSGVGFASFSAQQVSGSGSQTVTYDPALVLPGTTASTTIGSDLADAPPLAVDLDGNGAPDLVASSSGGVASSTPADAGGGSPPNATSTAAGTEDLSTTTVDALREVLCK